MWKNMFKPVIKFIFTIYLCAIKFAFWIIRYNFMNMYLAACIYITDVHALYICNGVVLLKANRLFTDYFPREVALCKRMFPGA